MSGAELRVGTTVFVFVITIRSSPIQGLFSDAAHQALSRMPE